nr:MAG TPA: major capsid protein [Caudoviricetes sp.]DAH23314.1 MAG TPA: major capsid protein [Caudoviricetes sp.]
MPAKTNLIMTNDIQVTAREIDFVTRFERNWEHLREILGIMRPIKKTPGAVLKSKYAEGTLQNGNVGEGEEIPYSKFVVKEKPYAEMTIEKYAKAVSIEAIKDHGYENAVQMTDDEFLFQLQTNVTERFYDYLKTGTLTFTEITFQMALAMAKGRVENKFKQMHRNVTGVVGFVNILDVYEYIGAANITIQNQFGFQYMKDFLGFNTIFLLSDSEIPRGTVIATPVENIVLYYVDPNESDFARAGLVYTVSGETNLIGFHTQGNYNTAVSEAFAIMGLTLFAEYIDAIAVGTINTTQTLGTLTVNSAAGSKSGDTKVTVTPAKVSAGNAYKYKVASSETAVDYGQNVKNWSAWDGESDITAATGQVITVVECDSTYKALSAGHATVTAK